MSAYPTCHGCTTDRRQCERLIRIKNAVRGLGLSSVKFRCPEKALPYTLGDPVWVRTDADLSVADDDRYIDQFPGHFLEMSGSKAICFVPDGAKGAAEGIIFTAGNSGFVKVSLAKVSPRDAPAPDRSVCAACKQPYGITGLCEGHPEHSTGCMASVQRTEP